MNYIDHLDRLFLFFKIKIPSFDCILAHFHHHFDGFCLLMAKNNPRFQPQSRGEKY